MTDKPTSNARQHRHVLLPVAAAGLLSFGLTMLLMSGAYMRDLSLLQQVPEAVWLFICGVPTDNEMTLPLLVGIGGLTMLVGAALVVIHQLKRAGRLGGYREHS